MSLKFYFNHLMSFFFFFLLSFHYLVSFDLNAPPDAPCEPFQCGNTYNITYPFWDRKTDVMNETLLCGYPGFDVECQNNTTPIVHISKLPYKILELDFNNSTLKLARQDLLKSPCDPIPLDTVIPSHDFEIPTNSGYKNLSLYYNCSTSPNIILPNQFMCGYETMNFFDDGSGNVSMAEIDCKMKIVVPLNDSLLEIPRDSSALHILGLALNSGFAIKWLADNALCAECIRILKGTCKYDKNTSRFMCAGTSAPWRPNPLSNSPPVVVPTLPGFSLISRL